MTARMMWEVGCVLVLMLVILVLAGCGELPAVEASLEGPEPAPGNPVSGVVEVTELGPVGETDVVRAAVELADDGFSCALVGQMSLVEAVDALSVCWPRYEWVLRGGGGPVALDLVVAGPGELGAVLREAWPEVSVRRDGLRWVIGGEPGVDRSRALEIVEPFGAEDVVTAAAAELGIECEAVGGRYWCRGEPAAMRRWSAWRDRVAGAYRYGGRLRAVSASGEEVSAVVEALGASDRVRVATIGGRTVLASASDGVLRDVERALRAVGDCVVRRVPRALGDAAEEQRAAIEAWGGGEVCSQPVALAGHWYVELPAGGEPGGWLDVVADAAVPARGYLRVRIVSGRLGADLDLAELEGIGGDAALSVRVVLIPYAGGQAAWTRQATDTVQGEAIAGAGGVVVQGQSARSAGLSIEVDGLVLDGGVVVGVTVNDTEAFGTGVRGVQCGGRVWAGTSPAWVCVEAGGTGDVALRPVKLEGSVSAGMDVYLVSVAWVTGGDLLEGVLEL